MLVCNLAVTKSTHVILLLSNPDILCKEELTSKTVDYFIRQYQAYNYENDLEITGFNYTLSSAEGCQHSYIWASIRIKTHHIIVLVFQVPATNRTVTRRIWRAWDFHIVYNFAFDLRYLRANWWGKFSVQVFKTSV